MPEKTATPATHIPDGAQHQTPAMRQFHTFKQRHPDCVLFFRMGDFYELFYDDARLAHKVLGVTLTQRTKGIDMAGVPYHAVDGYLRRMIQAGYRVAVCDQVEDPAQAKGVVKRDVTRVVTPGTLTESSLLDDSKDNPLAAVAFLDNQRVAIAWAELSTGAFWVSELHENEVADELSRLDPSELIYSQTATNETPPRAQNLLQRLNLTATGRPGWQFHRTETLELIRKHYSVHALTGFGLRDDDPEIIPAGAILHYLHETQQMGADTPASLAHLQPPKRFPRENHLVLDEAALRSLEIVRTTRSESEDGSLLSVFERPDTALGRRTLRRWLCYPLRDKNTIETRHAAVEALTQTPRLVDALRENLADVQDVERILARLTLGRASPRDVVALGNSTAQAQAINDNLTDQHALEPLADQITRHADALNHAAAIITERCVEEPPPHLREGGLIRDTIDPELDEARSLQRDSQAWLARYQKQLVEQIGVPSLKVGFNKVFGYYIELTAAHRDKAPDDWTRKQTLKNAERFITPQLKEYENKVLHAESRAVEREKQLFDQLCTEIITAAPALRAFADAVAELDTLLCFTRTATRHRYVRPQLTDDATLDITDGRHPVLDQILRDNFVPNNTSLGGSQQPALALITGPNMAGKSTFIRQAALITLLAHAGSFVPAKAARIGRTDRIFTRIGASDELHTGQSTFMVEMAETARMCHHATGQSLIILDEIGRGTSTLDGLSLAWAIAEHFATRPEPPRVLMATHYHELTDLADQLPDNVLNLHVRVREWNDQVVFLHRIEPGTTDRSYGIHVAKLAGMPPQVVQRANQLLNALADQHAAQDIASVAKPDTTPHAETEMPLFSRVLDHPAVDALRNLNMDTMTPLQAFDTLRQLSEQARQA
ncbi:DNA mismatch repair protein MutS [Mucisphaera calidilacus]|uniref:DNA mismatch repair protein MutS n=1 Tax=Mucisphaera calidilacus TaxID=2527982 RepID=A0A518BUP4_9BACT|nr:DNA mismatch repair protein MutS [Mucisphaera calidilacus]QDU70657.1 DNA mismatch repair protein MutS [Mucisphaera calidilacus]